MAFERSSVTLCDFIKVAQLTVPLFFTSHLSSFQLTYIFFAFFTQWRSKEVSFKQHFLKDRFILTQIINFCSLK